MIGLPVLGEALTLSLPLVRVLDEEEDDDDDDEDCCAAAGRLGITRDEG